MMPYGLYRHFKGGLYVVQDLVFTHEANGDKDVCKQLGGGGHTRAAGATLNHAPLEPNRSWQDPFTAIMSMLDTYEASL